MNTKALIEAARTAAASAEGSEEALFAAMGTLPARASIAPFSVRNARLSYSAKEMSGTGRRIFEKFKKYLKQAVCDDFNYCEKKAEVDGALDKYLPKIVELLVKRIPISGKVPTVLARILVALGIPVASVESLVVLLLAWLITKGCDALCDCRS